MAEKHRKTCFVIAPIGEDETEMRRRSDQVLAHIIKPAASECGYDAIRADEISEPGIITAQVIQHLIDDDLVIADLTDKNPNVFYELAVRHAIRRPVIQMIRSGETIPFDVAPTRTIHVDHRDLDSVAECKGELVKQIRSLELDPTKIDSPISMAIDLKSLRQSENPLEKSNAEILSMLQDLRSMVGDMVSQQRTPRLQPRMFEELFMTLGRISSSLNLPEGQEPTREQFDYVHRSIDRLSDLLEMVAAQSGIPGNLAGRLRPYRTRPV